MRSGLILMTIVLMLISCGGGDTDIRSDIAIPVTVEEVKLKPIEMYITTTGTVKAIQEATLKSETSGYYRLATNPRTQRPFALGDFVKKDEVIIYLDNPEYENSIKIESQRLNLEISKQEFEKQRSLYQKGGVTLRELKNAERSFIDAQYNYDNAVIQLSKLKVISPFDGTIIDLAYYTPDVKVDVGLPMVQVVNYRELYLEVNLPVKSMDQVKTNQSVRVMNYTMPDDTLYGKITQVSPALDPDTRSFKSTVLIDNKDTLLRPGMFTKAEIIIAKKDSAIVIPKDIILAKRRGKTIYIVQKGAAIEKTISTGLENPDMIEVTSGLKVNDRLVIKGFETLRNGSKVKIVR